MNVVIYARYSSHNQTEQSIEGQLQTCYEYAKNNGHVVIGEYIDRAQSGTNDNRSDFQRMITDSNKHVFEAVLVYQLDRFARNRYDMINIFVRAIYLFDDTITLVLNGGDRPITIDNILLDEIETYFESSMTDKGRCSPLVASAPPTKIALSRGFFVPK